MHNLSIRLKKRAEQLLPKIEVFFELFGAKIPQILCVEPDSVGMIPERIPLQDL